MMKRAIEMLAALLLSATGIAGAQTPAQPRMHLTTTAFTDGGVIPIKYTGAGESVSPALSWNNVPPGTASLVLLFHDPDTAPGRNAQDFTHWIVWNIPPTVTGLDEGIKEGPLLAGGAVQGKNGRGTFAYLGPGANAAGPEHHYTFELYALDTKLTLGPDASRADVLAAMNGHVIGKAALEGRFKRPS